MKHRTVDVFSYARTHSSTLRSTYPQKEKIQANSLRNQTKELPLGQIRNNMCLCNIAK
nr:MAG TPA: hypothetical protein [Caudoviricetes sp.]